MARAAKKHLALIRLADHNFQWPEAEAEYACLHVFKKLTKPSDDSGREPQRTQYTMETAGKFNNVMLCAGCKRKSEKCKTRHGSDKYLFVGLQKSGPGPLKPPPLPTSMRAKAGQ